MARIKKIKDSQSTLINKNIRISKKWNDLLLKLIEDQAEEGKINSVSDLIRTAIYEKWIKKTI